MSLDIARGSQQVIQGRLRVYYDGYWVKAYTAPADTLIAKKWLIQALTRRLFNHVEYGLNVPGSRSEEARKAYETETDPRMKRVKGAMLAGSLFNRATDVFTKLVEIQALGVEIKSDNALMQECGQHLQEALSLGKMVLHRSGEEGIDELWGEPFKAFAFPIEEFYKSRYVKIAMTMAHIDRIKEALRGTFETLPEFAGIGPLITDFARAAQAKCETLRTDPDVFDVWASFVVSAEKLSEYKPLLPPSPTFNEKQHAARGLDLIRQGKDLVTYIARARVTMPKSTREFIERCSAYQTSCVLASSFEPNLTPLSLLAEAMPLSDEPLAPARVSGTI